MSSPLPPPGWYPDGHTPNAVRWFDGSAWTEHVQAVAPAGYGPAGYGPAGYGVGPVDAGRDLGPSNGLHWLLPVGRSWQSIVAGYVGLFALFAWSAALAGGPGIGIAALVGGLSAALGVVALRRAASGGHGRGRAWFAVVAGALCLVLTALVMLRA